jgi:hypothetical protein
MSLNQFSDVLKRNWVPVQLVGNAVPDWLTGIPSSLLHSLYASGSVINGFSYSTNQIPSGSLIGGIDVYRHSPDDPVSLNKDWYAVVSIPNTDSMLLVVGPIKDAEHWLDKIPERLQGAEVLGVPPLPRSDSTT